MAELRCGKCGSTRSWVEQDSGGWLQRCVCGLCRPVVRKAEGSITVLHSVVRPSEVVLPAAGTKTRRCLIAVHRAWPGKIQTAQVAERSGLQNKETSSLLITLMARGLVERVSERRGFVGGSEWRLTVTALELLTP